MVSSHHHARAQTSIGCHFVQVSNGIAGARKEGRDVENAGGLLTEARAFNFCLLLSGIMPCIIVACGHLLPPIDSIAAGLGSSEGRAHSPVLWEAGHFCTIQHFPETPVYAGCQAKIRFDPHFWRIGLTIHG